MTVATKEGRSRIAIDTVPLPDKKIWLREWNQLRLDHPAFARSFLAQQIALMRAAEDGYVTVVSDMHAMLRADMPVLFADYWLTKAPSKKAQLRGILACLADNANRDPADCFKDDEDDGWFDDPFAGGREVPELPDDPRF